MKEKKILINVKFFFSPIICVQRNLRAMTRPHLKMRSKFLLGDEKLLGVSLLVPHWFLTGSLLV